MSQIKRLDFDTDLFGVPCFLIENYSDGETEQQMALLKSQTKRYLAYCYRNLSERIPSHILDSYNGKQVSIKRLYSLSLQNTESLIFSNGKFSNEEDLRDMDFELFMQSGIYSRYYVDSRLNKDFFNKLYRIWFAKTKSGDYSDYKCVALYENNRAGLLSMSFNGDDAYIDIIAVDHAFRGKGVGKYLMSIAFSEAEKNKAKMLKVITQADNLIACSFYERFGFSVEEDLLVYHFYRDEKNDG